MNFGFKSCFIEPAIRKIISQAVRTGSSLWLLTLDPDTGLPSSCRGNTNACIALYIDLLGEVTWRPPRHISTPCLVTLSGSNRASIVFCTLHSCPLPFQPLPGTPALAKTEHQSYGAPFLLSEICGLPSVVIWMTVMVAWEASNANSPLFFPNSTSNYNGVGGNSYGIVKLLLFK